MARTNQPISVESLRIWDIGNGKYPTWMTPHFTTTTQSKMLENKTGDLLWIVSHCNTPSDRTSFVHKLMRAIDGRLIKDQFGACNHKRFVEEDKWNKDNTDEMGKYKFYLALESNQCRGYITEKFFKVLKTKRVIPIVRGPARM